MTAVLAAAALLVAALLALELLLRGLGFASFPLFERAGHGRYRMRPDQAGLFRRRAAWRYDANGMRNDRIPADFAETTLLIGDSVVDGGNRIDQSETLATVAARLSGDSYYCVACHGWALANGLAELRALPGWTGARRLVFVLNTGDLDSVADMWNEFSFPSRRPIWLTLWLVRRQLFRRVPLYRKLWATLHASPEPPVGRAADVRARNLADFRQLLTEYDGPIFLVRYAMRGEDARAERYFEQLASLDPRVRILEAAEATGWSDDCYIDHIHPNARGLAVLAPHVCRGLS